MIMVNNIENDYGLHQLLHDVLEQEASDLHIMANAKPAFRLNGDIREMSEYPVYTKEMTKGMAEYIIKEILQGDIERFYEYDCSFSYKSYGRFRLNIYKTMGSFALAFRALPRRVKTFDELNLPAQIKKFAGRTNGLVLVTGPTGSGKSTTLASLIELINQERNAHIITIEDPIEYIYENERSLVTQREVNGDTKDFANALRSALRQDPDVILVGEMRDPETIQIAMSAAETGHLVLSTLHTVGAIKTIDRIIDSFEAGKQNQICSQLSGVLAGVVSQVLMPRADGTGRVMACEIMFNTPAIRNLIRERKPHQITSIMQATNNADMLLLDNELIRLCRQRVITPDEAISRAQDQEKVKAAVNIRR